MSTSKLDPLPTDERLKRPKQRLTVHQRLARASRRGTGIRLSADDVEMLVIWDDAVATAARNDDERMGISHE